MGKIKYLFKRIIKMDYKNMFKIAKAIAKKTKRNYISILVDMVKCGIKYQAGYYDYQEFEFYNLNKEQRKTYLTRGKNNEIVKRFNDKTSFHKFENKVEFNKIFNKYLKRNWMVLENNNYNEFEKFLKENLNLSLNKKTQIFKSKQGINFCGYKINEYRLKIRDKGKKKFKKKVKKLLNEIKEGKITSKDARIYLTGHIGYFETANTYNLKKRNIFLRDDIVKSKIFD